MKRLIFTLLCLVAILLPLNLSADSIRFRYEFQGQTITYTVLDESARTCTVEGKFAESYNTDVSGSLVLPVHPKYGDVEYTLTQIGNNAFYVCKNLTAVVIPNSVTSIGESAFDNCTSLTSVEIPNSVTSIGREAFRYCTSLTSVKLPDPVTSIGYNAFFECTSLTSVQFPNSLTTIGDYAFFECTSLTSVQLPDSLTSIGEAAFYRCTSLTSVQFPNSLTSIGKRAFQECTSLTSVQLPNSLTFIGGAAFYLCSKITSINIPPLVNSIVDVGFDSLKDLIIDDSGETLVVGFISHNIENLYLGRNISYEENKNIYTGFKDHLRLTDLTIGPKVTQVNTRDFTGCSDLKNVTILDGESRLNISWYFADCKIQQIEKVHIGRTLGYSSTGAFMQQKSLKEVTIGDKVTSIQYRMFAACSSLKSIILPRSIKGIGPFAFSGCSSLTSINIPSLVTKIYGSTFGGCPLDEIIIEDSAPPLVQEEEAEGGFAPIFSTNRIKKLYLGRDIISEDPPFQNNTLLTELTIGNNVTTLGQSIFSGCSALASVNIPNSVTEIGSKAFYNCSNLESIVISDNIKSFGEEIWNGCPNLKEISYRSSNPVGEEMSMFNDNVYSDAMLYIDESARKKISSIKPWRAFENVNGEQVQTYTFTYKYSGSEATLTGVNLDRTINSIIIPSETEINGKKFAVTSISNNAFRSSDKFKTVTIPESVTNIAPGAFEGCSNLITVNYNAVNAASSESHSASPIFANCNKLSKINIGDAVTTIPAYYFKNCFALREVTIGKAVETIEDDAFMVSGNNNSLNSLNINFNPVRLKKYANAFTNCAIDTIRFGEEVEKCPKNTLRDCRPSVIESFNPFPPSMGDYSLESANKATCKLLVPVGSKTEYSNAYIWRQFNNISDELTGIEDVTVDADLDDSTPVTAYTLTGQKVYSGLRSEMSLKPGLYIIVQGQKTSKLAIK